MGSFQNNIKIKLVSKPLKSIRLVGVGGGGNNLIDFMIQQGNYNNIDLVAVDTDAAILEASSAPYKIQIGVELVKGLDAGMKPSIGKESALESYNEIRTALAGADIVFISAGLGGGTGTGAAPVIAQIAKEIGALTISLVTKPFAFEGKKRLKLAEDGLQELKKESDSIVVIPNDKLLSIIDRKLGIKDSFKIVDSVLAQAVSGTAGVILSNGDNDINLDFADLRTVMSHKGMALMGVGEHEGENAAYEAIKAAIESPLLDNVSINGAMGVLVHFNMHPNFPMIEISDAMEVVQESAHEDADVIFGTSTDESLPENYVKITIIATGFEHYERFDEVEKLVIKNLITSGWDKNDITINTKDRIDILLKYKNETIAVIELKSQKNRLKEGLEKAIANAKKLNIPFAFATDGKEIYEYNLMTLQESILTSFPSSNSLQRMIDNDQLVSHRGISKKNVTNKILWVDDRSYNNKSERRMFEKKGITFDLALSTNEALEYLKDNKYLAIISDMGRKEGTQEGYVLLDKLREIDKNIPLFFYAGSNLEEHKKMALERGAQGSTNNSAELYKMVMNLIQKNENSIIEENYKTKNVASDITFECLECGTEYFTGCTELDWEQVGGNERGMGAETEYEAEYYETCHECNNDMSITFSCWEYPVGAEGYRDIVGKGIKNLKGDCCLKFNSFDKEYTEDYDEFTVSADTSYSTLEEKIKELETFVNNLIPYSELEFTYDSEDFSNEKDIPFDQFLISREFDSQYLDDLIDEIKEDINEVQFALDYNSSDNLGNNISNNSLLLKKQYTVEYDDAPNAYGVDIDCNVYEEDNKQILYIYPSSKIEFDEDILDVEEEIVDIDIDKAEAEMKEWFFKNYEDPANFLPYTVYGSPYKFDEILYKEFGDKYPDYYIQKAIENLENEHGDISWTKRPKEDRDLEIIKSIKKYPVYELSHFFIISLQMHGVNSGIIDRLMTLNKRCDFLYELYKILDEATRGANQENRQNIINDFCKKIDFEFNFINDYMILRKIFDNCKKYNEIHNIESDEENLNIDKAEEEMKDWFLENYDDPVNFLPHESREGGFQYLYGGPYELDEILYEEFGGKYPDDYIQKVVENLEHEHGDIAWGKRPSETDVYEEGVYAEKGYTDQKVYIPSSGGKVYEFDVSNKFYDINIYKISEQAIKESQALKEMIVEKGATHQGTVSFHNDIKGNIDELNKLIKDFQDIFGQEKGLSFYSIMHSEDDIYKYNSKTSKNIDIDNVINATIDGDFEGWSGESIVKLTNGETWKQSEYYYEYIYAFMPNAIITHSQTGYKMKVDGVNEEVGVEKLKNVIESKIRGSFNGWSGNTIVELINDEKWKQSTYKYSYSYAYSPDVIIYQSDYGFKMKVDGNNETVDVERVI